MRRLMFPIRLGLLTLLTATAFAVPVADPAHPRPQILAGDPPSALTPPSGCVFHKRCAERLGLCDEIVPPEIDLPADTGPGSPESDRCGENHRVRCHLWNN